MSYRNENISYPGPAWRPALTFTPENHYERLRTNPNATEMYWWSAIPDLNWNNATNSGAFGAEPGASNGSRFVREQQNGGPYWAIIEGERVLRRYFQPGSIESGDIAVLYNPNDGGGFAPAEFDWLVQKGQGFGYPGELVAGVGTVDLTEDVAAAVGVGTAFTSFFVPGAIFSAGAFAAAVVAIADDTHLTLALAPAISLAGSAYSLGGAFPGAIDARTITQKETLTRGAVPLAGVGSVHVAGTAVTGTGTSFSTLFHVADTFLGPNGFAARITAIADDTHLTLDVAPGATFTGVPYSKGVDYLLYGPAAFVRLLRDGTREYVAGTDFEIDPTGEFIQWLAQGASPAPGTRYAIVYDYYTRYIVTGLGQQGAVVKGQPLLKLVTARLWKPEHSRR